MTLRPRTVLVRFQSLSPGFLAIVRQGSGILRSEVAPNVDEVLHVERDVIADFDIAMATSGKWYSEWLLQRAEVVLQARKSRPALCESASFQADLRAGDGIRTRDVHLGKVALYH